MPPPAVGNAPLVADHVYTRPGNQAATSSFAVVEGQGSENRKAGVGVTGVVAVLPVVSLVLVDVPVATGESVGSFICP
jgi:hypothetical protein